MEEAFKLWPRLGRWLLRRLKRAALLVTFLGLVIFVVVSAFLAINKEHAQFSGIAAQLRGIGGLGPEQSDMLAIEKVKYEPTQMSARRPNVQYFPDNMRQQKPAKFAARSGTNRIGVIDLDEEESLKVNSNFMTSTGQPFVTTLASRVHTFYYAWYGNPEHDGKWYHWNHEYLQNWDKNDKRQFPVGISHRPERDDIGANFYPKLGCYSSQDPAVMKTHMSMMKSANIGVVVLSWYPPGLNDEHGPPVDAIVPTLLDAATKVGLKIAFHIEPYAGRSPVTLRANLKYINESYGNHSAFYKYKGKPLYYIYDSYLTPTIEWKRLLTPAGDLSVRGTDLDATFIGLLVDYKHRTAISAGGFDGFYTYFAANGFSYGSTWKNWRNLAVFARKYSLLFIPSLGPGYNDLRVRPWNGQATRLRRKGLYYGLGWRTFLELKLPLISITSFNEWHEGTQIEPAVPKSIEGYSYSSYLPDFPDCYLRQTSEWIEKWNKY